MMDYAERAKSCPHIVSSDEGTIYCALAEHRIRELVAERDRLREAIAHHRARTCDRLEEMTGSMIDENLWTVLEDALRDSD